MLTAAAHVAAATVRLTLLRMLSIADVYARCPRRVSTKVALTHGNRDVLATGCTGRPVRLTCVERSDEA